MKYRLIYILVSSVIFLLLIRWLYYLYINNNKNNLLNKILKQWKTQTNNAYIQKVTMGVYTDDYILSFSEIHDQKTHIHLITNQFYSNFNEFISLFFKPQFELIPTTTIGYIIKKNSKYLTPIQINQQNDPYNIVQNMIKTYETIDMY